MRACEVVGSLVHFLRIAVCETFTVRGSKTANDGRERRCELEAAMLGLVDCIRDIARSYESQVGNVVNEYASCQQTSGLGDGLAHPVNSSYSLPYLSKLLHTSLGSCVIGQKFDSTDLLGFFSGSLLLDFVMFLRTDAFRAIASTRQVTCPIAHSLGYKRKSSCEGILS